MPAEEISITAMKGSWMLRRKLANRDIALWPSFRCGAGGLPCRVVRRGITEHRPLLSICRAITPPSAGERHAKRRSEHDLRLAAAAGIVLPELPRRLSAAPASLTSPQIQILGGLGLVL